MLKSDTGHVLVWVIRWSGYVFYNEPVIRDRKRSVTFYSYLNIGQVSGSFREWSNNLLKD
jgi:hypothetical protein